MEAKRVADSDDKSQRLDFSLREDSPSESRIFDTLPSFVNWVLLAFPADAFYVRSHVLELIRNHEQRLQFEREFTTRLTERQLTQFPPPKPILDDKACIKLSDAALTSLGLAIGDVAYISTPTASYYGVVALWAVMALDPCESVRFDLVEPQA